MENKSNRIEWIDFLKFVAIFFVVFTHAGMPTIIDNYFRVFRMPVFFFLSGYFFKSSPFGQFLIKRVKSLLVPYFVFPIVIFYFWFAVYLLIGEQFPENMNALWISLFTYNADISPFAAVQWFLTCLFVTEIIFYWIVRVSKNNILVITALLLCFSVIGYLWKPLIGVRLYWAADVAITAVVFYGIGYLFNNIKLAKVKAFILNPSIIKLVSFFIISAALVYLNGRVRMRTLDYGNYFLFYISAFASIAFFIMLSILICESPKLNRLWLYKQSLYLGKNTLIILIFNQFFIKILKHLTNYIGFTKFETVFIIFAVMALSIPVSFAVNKYIPFTLGKPFTKATVGKQH